MKLKITTHSGQILNAEVSEYNPEELNESLNNVDINTIVLGNVIISRIDVKTVVPVEIENN